MSIVNTKSASATPAIISKWITPSHVQVTKSPTYEGKDAKYNFDNNLDQLKDFWRKLLQYWCIFVAESADSF